MKLAAYVGSLRKDSINRKLLRALAGRLPSHVSIEEQIYDQVPLFNSDLEKPASVVKLDAALRDADGVVIVTPEYNYGIPGPLKNVLDWLSRPAYQSGFAQKPVTLLGASAGLVGTARAQGQLKQVLLGMAAHVYPSPEVTVGQAAEKFDESGQLIDEKTGKALERLLSGFLPFVEKSASAASKE